MKNMFICWIVFPISNSKKIETWFITISVGFHFSSFVVFPESVWAKGSSNSGGLLYIFTCSHLHHIFITSSSHLHHIFIIYPSPPLSLSISLSLYISLSLSLLIFSSFHRHIFSSSSHLHHILSSSHLHIVSFSHLHSLSFSLSLSSHLLIFTFSHIHHIFITSSSHLHHIFIITSSHRFIFTSSLSILLPLFLSFSLSLSFPALSLSLSLSSSPPCPLLWSLSFFSLLSLGHGRCRRGATNGHPFARNEVRSSKTEGFSANLVGPLEGSVCKGFGEFCV